MQGMKSGLLLLLPPLALAGNQWNVTLPGGSMRFQGLIMASSCRVEAGRSADDGQSGADQQ
ncbi:type 1 pilus biosynthesis fimbrial protein [Klebsiella variicola]|nr:type 1 pilus biosynthesis fimbrial protein [Klebsiella variicola]